MSIRLSDAQREVWSGAAYEEDISLEEFVRRAADQRAIDVATATNPDGRSAKAIRALIEHYQAMLAVIENFSSKQELGFVGITGCLAGVCHRYAALFDFVPLS